MSVAMYGEFRISVSQMFVYALAAAIFLASILMGNIYLVALSSMSLVASVALTTSGNVINAMLIKKFRIIEIKNGYKLHDTMHAAVKRRGESFEALAVAKLLPESNGASERDMFEQVISKTMFPFDFCISMSGRDADKAAESLKMKMYSKEISLNDTPKGDIRRANALKREISMLKQELAAMANGTKPMLVTFYMRTTAIAKNEYEAASLAYYQMQNLCSTFASSFNLAAEIVEGEEILTWV